MSAQRPYDGRRVALLTQHGKERVIAPVLESGLGVLVEHVSGFDTDQLGTFTRDIPRPGSQLEAARRKARKGMELSGLTLGLASEGSFGADPFTGMFPWNVEILLWIDDELGLEIVGTAQGANRNGQLQSGDWSAMQDFARREGFPTQQLVLRPQGPDHPHICRGIADWAALQEHFDDCIARSSNGQVFVEPDLRAFANPPRMKQIERAAADLVLRIQSACPVCAAPGFQLTERQPGLPCSACGLPTAGHRREVWSCQRCSHRELRDRTDRFFADPAHCAYCNP